jgi:hypothetical protein
MPGTDNGHEDNYKAGQLIGVVLATLLLFTCFFISFLLAPIGVLGLFWVFFSTSDRSRRKKWNENGGANAFSRSSFEQQEYEQQDVYAHDPPLRPYGGRPPQAEPPPPIYPPDRSHRNVPIEFEGNYQGVYGTTYQGSYQPRRRDSHQSGRPQTSFRRQYSEEVEENPALSGKRPSPTL